MNYAYGGDAAKCGAFPENSFAHLRAISCGRGRGGWGMIAGQVQDVHLEGEPIGFEELSYIHRHKTGDMITGALLSGLELHDPTEEERRGALPLWRKCRFSISDR